MTSRGALIFAGIIDILFGLALLVYPVGTISFLLVFFAIYAILQGVVLFVAAFAGGETRSLRWWLALGGVASFLIGLVALFYQAAALLILIYFISFRALFVGISEVITSIRLRKEIRGEFLLGLVGVLNILFSLFILFYPLASATVLILVLGWYSIIAGIFLLIRGFMTTTQSV